MSGFRGLIGGLATAGSELAGNYIKREDEEESEKRKNDAAMAREQSMLRLRMTLENESRAAQAGRIDAAAGTIADQAVGQTKALVGAGIADKEAWTPEQQAAVDQSVAADRSAIIGDPMTRVKAAGMTGDLRADQVATVELGEQRAKREDKKGDQRYEIEKEKVEIDSKRLDAQLKHQENTLAETIRHNKQVEANSANKADKLSPAAKAQLEIAQNKVQSAHKEEAIAARALDAAMKSTEFDPEKKKADIAAARAEFVAAKNAVAAANANYDKTGAAHLGADWKTIEQDKPAEPAKQDVRVAGKVIGQAATAEEAQAMVRAHTEAGKKPKGDKPLIGGTSGSHAPAASDNSAQLRTQIVEKRKRAALQGIDPEVKAQLLLEARDLESKLNGNSLLR